MKLYALSDLHLSGDPPQKPMDIFGPHWQDHRERILKAWREMVTEEDYVLVSGDISWAMRLEEALPDLYTVASLPGTAILLRGNHDYWWCGVKKMQTVTANQMLFLYNNYISVGQTAICGTRGWIAPGDTKFTDADQTVFEREVSRMERSLSMARRDGYTNLIATTHYPPLNEKKEPTALFEVAREYGVISYIYGHLHDEQSFREMPTVYDGIPLYLTSADYLQFKPVEIPLEK